jgi:glycosyltransferase involved in cell wall biosynthesis
MTKHAAPAVSVIVPARDARPTIARTVEAIEEQDLDAPFEVIVVDDGSRDDTAAVARRSGRRTTVVQGRGEGPGAARNRGVDAARAPVLAFTDADCFPTKGWLSAGLAALDGAELVQGAVAPDPSAVRSPFDRTVVVDRDRGLYQTANLFVRRELFDRVGGFQDWALVSARGERRSWSEDRRRARARRTPIGEDTLFAWKARRSGARVTFAPQALVHHEVVPGGVLDELADRLHWTRDMPGLVARVPELRSSCFYHQLFFHARTAYFDLAFACLAAALLSRRAWPLLGAVPYARWLRSEAAAWGGTRAAVFTAGSVVLDAATLVGLASGSVAWRCLVL